jgi:hypothetical protein
MVEHALKRGWPTCDPREKYLQPSVTSVVPVIQSDTKKRELLKNPTKIEEIQEKKLGRRHK